MLKHVLRVAALIAGFEDAHKQRYGFLAEEEGQVDRQQRDLEQQERRCCRQ